MSEQKRPSSRRSMLIALLACALTGVAAVGYMAWQKRQGQAQLAEFMTPLARQPSTQPVEPDPVDPEENAAPAVELPAEAPRFVNVAEEAGLTHVQDTRTIQDLGHSAQTGAAAALDYDNDGWLDLFVTRLDHPPILYRNMGRDSDGIVRFKDVTATAHLEQPTIGSNGIAAADFDSDGHVDLFVSTTQQNRYYLFMNQGDGTFTEEAVQRNAHVPLTETQHYGHSAAAGDYDGDGYLDLAICEWDVNPVEDQVGFRLLHNLGAARPGYFQDVTRSSGILTITDYEKDKKRPLDWSFTARFTDLDQDGLVDLAICSDYGTSRMYWNNGDGTFTDGTADAGLGSGTNEMGSTIADFDGDGQLDWFVSSIYYGPPDHPDQGNRLYRNEGDRMFSDRGHDMGVAKSGWGWGSAFIDYDNDSDFDLIATNGFPAAGKFDRDQTRFWQNNGEGGLETTFTDLTLSTGINDDLQGRGVVVFDYDNDGDLDVYISNFGAKGILYRNEGGNRMSWLRVALTGRISNIQGANALITVSDPRLKWPLVYESSLGSNFLGQSEPIVHFGLADLADSVESVTIKWPSGKVQRFADVPVKKLFHVTEDDPEGVATEPGQPGAAAAIVRQQPPADLSERPSSPAAGAPAPRAGGAVVGSTD